MKWVTTFYKTAGLFFVILSVLNFGCKSHSPETLANSDLIQNNLQIYDSVHSHNYLMGSQSPDSISANQDFLDSKELLYGVELIESVDWEHRQSSVDEHRITFDIKHQADSIVTEIFACNQSWDEIVRCSDIAYFTITAIKGDREVTRRDSINLKFLNDLFVLDRIEN